MAATRYTGRAIPRVEDAKLLRGRAPYLADVTLPGMLEAAFLRSPYPHARIRDIDASAARAVDGVHAVLVGADLADHPGLVTVIPRPEAGTSRRPLLAYDRARCEGDPVAVVVAASRAIAEDACERISVDWEPLPAIVDAEAALHPDAQQLDPDLPGNTFAHIEFENGNTDAAFAAADHVITKRFHTGRVHAAPLESRGVAAQWDAFTGDLTVWASSQFPFYIRNVLADLLDLPQTRVRVHTPAVGGGFGFKVHVYVEDVIIPMLARQLGRPVRWIEDRRENLVGSGHSKEVICDLELALRADGTFLALRGRYIGDSGAYQGYPWSGLIDPLCAASFLPGIYQVPAVHYEVDAAVTNKCQSVAYRGVGWTPGQNAREALIDDAARELGIDPIELRLKNCIPDGAPFTTATGCNYDGNSFAALMRAAQRIVDYDAFRTRQQEAREQGRYLGIGFSPFVEQGAWADRISRVNGFPGFNYVDAVSITVEPDGSVTVTTGLQSNGQGHETTMAQVVADELGVRFEDVRIIQGDTATTAYAAGSYGSRTAVVAGEAIADAAAPVKDKLTKLAAHHLKVSADEIVINDGTATVPGVPSASVTIKELAANAYFGDRPKDFDPMLQATRSATTPETYSNACIAVIVDVDTETGVITCSASWRSRTAGR